MTIELDTTLAQAEVLFLSFAQLVADIDRRKAEVDSDSSLRKRRQTLQDGPGTDTARASGINAKVTTKIPEMSQQLRDLLKAGR